VPRVNGKRLLQCYLRINRVAGKQLRFAKLIQRFGVIRPALRYGQQRLHGVAMAAQLFVGGAKLGKHFSGLFALRIVF